MKAIVIEKKGSRCIVLKENGVFCEERDRGYFIGQQISSGQPLFVKMLAACASVLILIVLFSYGIFEGKTAKEYIYLDINPSLRLEINGFDRVIRVVPLNADAEMLLNKHSIRKNEPYDCIMTIIENCIEDGYINQNNLDVELHYSTGSKTVKGSVTDAVSDMISSGLIPQSFELKNEERRAAEEMGVSAGWVRAAARYSEEFGGSVKENAQTLLPLGTEEIYARTRSERHGKEQVTKGETVSINKRQAVIHVYALTFGITESESADTLEKLSVKEILNLLEQKEDEECGEQTPAPTPKATKKENNKASRRNRRVPSLSSMSSPSPTPIPAEKTPETTPAPAASAEPLKTEKTGKNFSAKAEKKYSPDEKELFFRNLRAKKVLKEKVNHTPAAKERAAVKAEENAPAHTAPLPSEAPNRLFKQNYRKTQKQHFSAGVPKA